MKRKLAENLKRIQHRIQDACHKARRPVEDVVLVAVTKKVGLEVIRELCELGVEHLGENRVAELVHRAAMLREQVDRRSRAQDEQVMLPCWHMVGHLQRNKVKTLLPWVDLIHSVDSLRLAEEIDAQAAGLNQVVPVLVEVNGGGEASKFGVAVAAVNHLVEQLASLKHLELRGLMSMAPRSDDPSTSRFTFERMRELFDEIRSAGLGGPMFKELSLGMSNDFEQGIEFGATYVRIGSALFEGLDLGPVAEPLDSPAVS